MGDGGGRSEQLDFIFDVDNFLLELPSVGVILGVGIWVGFLDRPFELDLV